MNEVLSQSATNLTVSNGEHEWKEEQFVAAANRACERSAKGTTRERQMLNRNKLISAVCADYRAHFAAIYGKTDRLPSATYELIEKSVDTVINKHLMRVNPANAISFRRSFFHNGNEMEVTERVQATGENKLSLQEQLLGVDTFIKSAERRLKDLEAKKTPDYDREKEVKAQILKFNITRQFIVGEMKHQETVTPTVA